MPLLPATAPRDAPTATPTEPDDYTGRVLRTFQGHSLWSGRCTDPRPEAARRLGRFVFRVLWACGCMSRQYLSYRTTERQMMAGPSCGHHHASS